MSASHSKTETLDDLLSRVRACTLCAKDLPLGPRPVLSAAPSSRILLVGQAPGTRVHASGVPWDDASGKRLREWLGLDPTVFYDASQIAILPMGFCYPGAGKGGDLPPRPECARAWRDALLARLPAIELTILIGRYAQKWHLGPRCEATLTATVAAFERFLPEIYVTPHPSPRNQWWFKNHPWFDARLVPSLRRRVAAVLRA